VEKTARRVLYLVKSSFPLGKSSKTMSKGGSDHMNSCLPKNRVFWGFLGFFGIFGVFDVFTFEVIFMIFLLIFEFFFELFLYFLFIFNIFLFSVGSPLPLAPPYL